MTDLFGGIIHRAGCLWTFPLTAVLFNISMKTGAVRGLEGYIKRLAWMGLTARRVHITEKHLRQDMLTSMILRTHVWNVKNITKKAFLFSGRTI